MKQTAVEWLEEQTRKPEWHSLKRQDIFEQAKEMEKQKNINILVEFSKANFDIHTEEAILNITRRAEKYYNGIFKQQEQ